MSNLIDKAVNQNKMSETLMLRSIWQILHLGHMFKIQKVAKEPYTNGLKMNLIEEVVFDLNPDSISRVEDCQW